MDFPWEKYPELMYHLGKEKCLRTEPSKIHPIFTLQNETEFLSSLDKYLRNVKVKKETDDNLRAPNMFFDVFYELEIAYFLRQSGFEPELNEEIPDSSGNKCETDILLREQELVIEVSHLHQPYRAESASAQIKPKLKKQDTPKGINGTILKTINLGKMKDYLDKKHFQDVYPIIVCFCPDISGGNCDDLAELVCSQDYTIPKEVSALALWKYKRTQCLYNNPCSKKFRLKSSNLKDFFCQK
jgi:hypothetical protein